jgi:hypothetical protein
MFKYKVLFGFFLSLGFVLAAIDAGAGTIESDLRDELAQTGAVDIIVKMDSTADLGDATVVTERTQKAQLVFDLLVAHAADSQGAVARCWIKRVSGIWSFGSIIVLP